MMAVGYDTTKGNDYALLQNSWGTDWGEEGYVKMDFGSNACGFLFESHYIQM